ncbi:valine--tRNA ligase [Gehongia tenuis]|uniref:Valine--tRNA ligase n=1 Tax=Gehongia tenuis TaxID=2763655 RepID=A0A926HQH6_9FIRM|nr:valine--tRNA ligase [Gehongia tenuis]MBC8531261.1 valine--tRNA ligase [Gehongia tenuis]
MKIMDKVYDPKTVEGPLYEKWEKSGAFHAEVDPHKKPFTIVIPPPNITGQLHMGHALDDTIQDILIRTKRMQGYSALWMPGTDHASIATEVKIVQQMAEEGLTKVDTGRDGFLERAWAWKDQYGGRITEQLKKLGASLDWERERFTMDEGCSKAVQEVFINLYNKGIIYQGDRIINWCPHCVTALSDAEVEYEEQDSHFWHFRYPAADGGEGIVIATTRPETLLGDTAVAVHPDDERYRHLIGKTLVLPLTGREIPVVADEYVDREFGTGAVKITPAHDPNDFEVGLRHGLPMIRVMDDHGVMNEKAGKYEGMDRFECRDALVNDMRKLGLLVKIEDHTHNVGTCYRCKSAVEPILSKQWFVKMKPLAEPALEAVRDGRIRFVPERFAKIYYNWMENIRDWCISRQLWWGHRIPAYYCEACGHVHVGKEMPEKCAACGHTCLHQDEDVLDTWFSSALWPFSTLGWPDKTPELDYFYPTSVLVTAYDIIFFWVARMIFSGIEHMGEIPFKDVLIHGIVRDSEGRKMSKSLGNGIDPLEVIEKYGADALRFSLVIGTSPGNDMRFYWEKVESARNFANKIWNASRYVMMNLPEGELPDFEVQDLDLADRWILTRLSEAVAEITENMERYEVGLCAQKLYDFIWSEFCDWYIELTKSRLNGEDEKAKNTARSVLKYVLETILKLLHPFMPFLTETIYDALRGESLMLSAWPKVNEALRFPEDAASMESIMEVIRSVRNLRSEMNVPPSKRAQFFVLPQQSDAKSLKATQAYLLRLAGGAGATYIAAKNEAPEHAVCAIAPAAEVYIPLLELVDKQKEIARLSKELKTIEGEIKRAEGKLNNPGFVAKAPAALVEEERAKLAKNEELIERVRERMENLQRMN